MQKERKTKTTTSTVQKAALPTGEKVDKFQLGELGIQGLNAFAGVSKEEIKKELQWPKSIKTYKKML